MKSGVTTAHFHAEGKQQMFKDTLNNYVNEADRNGAQAINMLLVRILFATAFDGVRDSNLRRTTCSDIGGNVKQR